MCDALRSGPDLDVDGDDLRFWADGDRRLLESGDFTVTVGDGTDEHRLKLRLEDAA